MKFTHLVREIESAGTLSQNKVSLFCYFAIMSLLSACRRILLNFLLKSLMKPIGKRILLHFEYVAFFYCLFL